MLAEVTGRVLHVHLDRVVVGVGGMGLLVRATPRTLSTLRPGADARLATSLVVREDSLTLFGFADDDERDVFELLQTVSGVGPRLALAVLAVLEPDALRAAVAGQDEKALTAVPGIGRKGAQRMLLELGDRLGALPSPGAPRPGGTTGGAGADAAPAVAAGGVPEQVVAALVGLGWQQRQAEDAVARVPVDDGVDMEASQLLRAALRGLAPA
ncbi:Holliday junction branch migration protein RuvA [Aquipuribacter sp. SD81]|uniref:Holliday junction branch migration protein RuvA n=1 Tax=Aquipuribacter sp. SD81 TaxID=3127703 RepID=UPI0030182C34